MLYPSDLLFSHFKVFKIHQSLQRFIKLYTQKQTSIFKNIPQIQYKKNLYILD